jgi:hypothetical protein
MKNKLIVICAVIVFFIPSFCHSNDTDLKDIIDSQGNKYRVDEKDDIYSDGIPHPNRQPASVENLGYYFNQAGMLEVNGYTDEAEKMYQEILSLPDDNDSVKTAKEAINLRLERRGR